MAEIGLEQLADLPARRFVSPHTGPVEDLLGVALALDAWADRESAAGHPDRAARVRSSGRLVRTALELLADLAIKPPEAIP